MQRWMLATLLITFTLGAAGAAAHQPNRPRHLCPQGYKDRTPEQVLADHRAWLAVGDVDKDATCNYAEDAVVIADQGVDQGREAIRASLQAFVGFFGGVVPIVHREIVVAVLNDHTHMVQVLFSVETPCVDVPDGADTYVIKRGQIHGQTSHGFPVFKCAPPPGP